MKLILSYFSWVVILALSSLFSGLLILWNKNMEFRQSVHILDLEKVPIEANMWFKMLWMGILFILEIRGQLLFFRFVDWLFEKNTNSVITMYVSWSFQKMGERKDKKKLDEKRSTPFNDNHYHSSSSFAWYFSSNCQRTVV